jgi:hypothetical protein
LRRGVQMVQSGEINDAKTMCALLFLEKMAHRGAR